MMTPDEDAPMAEVFDDSLYIEHWLESSTPALSNITFEEKDLITSFPINEDEPIVKEATGYMGNYGPDLMHWYHYGAVIIWTPEVNSKLLVLENTETKLNWIDYFSKNPGRPINDEVMAVNLILLMANFDTRVKTKTHYNVVADWLINRQDDTLLLGSVPSSCQFYLIQIDADYWLKLFDIFRPAGLEMFFELVTEDMDTRVAEHLLAVLRAMSASGRFQALVADQVQMLPQYFAVAAKNASDGSFMLSGPTLRDVFWLEHQMPQEEAWVTGMTGVIAGHLTRTYIHEVLAPSLLAAKRTGKLVPQLLLAVRQYLQPRAEDEPQEPADWVQELPATDRNKQQWAILKRFLESPHDVSFDYRAKKDERAEMEHAIRHAKIDLNTETIRKGSPHTLRITKTRGAYLRAVKHWQEDVALLKKMESGPGSLI